MDAGPDQAYGCLLESKKRCLVDARAAWASVGVADRAFGKRRPCVRSLGERGVGIDPGTWPAIGGRSNGLEPHQTRNNRIQNFDGRLAESARTGQEARQLSNDS